MEKHYSQLLVFYYIAEYMSFTKAAKHLNCSKAHASKQITDLEQVIGSPLLYRNTRSIRLTFAGETLFNHALHIPTQIDQRFQFNSIKDSTPNRSVIPI